MQLVIIALGVGQILAAALIYQAASSALHEVFFAVLFGSGSICLGIAAILSKLDGLRSAIAATPPAVAPSAGAGEVVKIYKGHKIVRDSTGVRVDQMVFPGVLAAEKHIDQLG